MRHQPVDRRAVEAVRRERLIDHRAELGDGDLEDFLAGHGDRDRRRRSRVDTPLRAVEHLVVAAVGVQVRGEHARRTRTGSSTTAPAPSANSTAVPRSFQSVMRESVSEPITSARLASPQRTYLSAIESAYMKPAQAVSTLKAGHAEAAEALLQQHAAVGEDQIRRGRAEGDEVDILGRQAGGLQGAPRGLLGQIHRGLAVGGDVAALDAGARADPLIGRVDLLLEFAIGDDALRQIRAGAADARVDQLPVPCACMPARCAWSGRVAPRAPRCRWRARTPHRRRDRGFLPRSRQVPPCRRRCSGADRGSRRRGAAPGAPRGRRGGRAKEA